MLLVCPARTEYGALVRWGRQAGSGSPDGVYTSICGSPAANSTCPEGSSSILPTNGGPPALLGLGTEFRAVPSNSKNWVGLGKVPPSPAGPATQRTLPLGSRQAGASLASIRLPFASGGKLGPVTQVPGWSATLGGV